MNSLTIIMVSEFIMMVSSLYDGEWVHNDDEFIMMVNSLWWWVHDYREIDKMGKWW